jgi:hypothetical protein
MADAAEKNIPLLSKSLAHLGGSIVTGVLKGISASSSELMNEMKQLALDALSEFKKALGIDSPSKAFFKESKFIPMGAAEGIKHYAFLAYDQIRDFGSGIVSKFGSAVSNISDGIDTNMNFSPTISPVVDLTDIKKSGSEIDALLANKTLNLSLSTDKAATISQGLPGSLSSLVPDNAQEVTKSTVVSLTQNNYSPKELSRIDIYRQTKNQILQLKGLVGT